MIQNEKKNFNLKKSIPVGQANKYRYLVDLDLVECVGEGLVEDELVPVQDLLALRSLADHAGLATRQRLQRKIVYRKIYNAQTCWSAFQ